MALAGALMVVAAGLVATYLYVGSGANLLTTMYGRVLMLKILAFCVAANCGFFNWRSLHRDSMSIEPTALRFQRYSRAVRLELAFAAILIAITGVVTELAHP